MRVEAAVSDSDWLMADGLAPENAGGKLSPAKLSLKSRRLGVHVSRQLDSNR